MGKKYNVLLLMTDQHRFDVLGCMGNSFISTPNLDKIAAEGTVFEKAYTACPSCIPARACLLTGMNQWHTGVLGMGRGQCEMGTGFSHTLPGELAKAGYQNCGIGKMHFFPQRSLHGFHRTILYEETRRYDPGFTSDYFRWFEEHKDGDYGMADGVDWNGSQGYPYELPEFLHPNEWTANAAINFFNDRDSGKPFFLKVSFARPHSPYDPIPEYFEQYNSSDLPKAQVGDWATINDDPEEAAKSSAWRGIKSEEEIHNARAGYYGNVAHIDHEIGRILAKLEAQGELDDTLILFTSDHGDMLGDQNMWRKSYAFEGSAHIPMLLCLPKALRNDVVPRSSKPVMLRDIMPTILDILGLDIPGSVDGLSMKSPALDANCSWREYAHGEHSACYDFENEMQYLTDGKIKYIWYPTTGREQLFDLAQDPYELHELSTVPNYGDVLQEWRLKLVRELEQRDCGLTDGDELVCQEARGPIVSPHYFERICRAPKAEKEMFQNKYNFSLADSPEQLTAKVRSGLLFDRYAKSKK
jgi:arylsulfatase